MILSALQQNSTLSIQSRVPKTQLRILPQWCDARSISISILDNNNNSNIDFRITRVKNKITSLVRSKAHISIEVNLKIITHYK